MNIKGVVTLLQNDYGLLRRPGGRPDIRFYTKTAYPNIQHRDEVLFDESTDHSDRPIAIHIRRLSSSSISSSSSSSSSAPSSSGLRERRLPIGWNSDRVYVGTCVTINPKGFGFIQPRESDGIGENVFFHFSQLAHGYSNVSVGDSVLFFFFFLTFFFFIWRFSVFLWDPVVVEAYKR